jgi:LysM repeat protein
MNGSRITVHLLPVVFVVLCLTACERPDPEVNILSVGNVTAVPPTLAALSFNQIGIAPPEPAAPTATALPYSHTPTPDPPHYDSTSGSGQELHTINSGDTLGYIAQLYGVSLEEILAMNELQVTDILQVGQQIRIPGQASLVGPSFKIVPDSELVFGPAARGFYVRQTAAFYNGYLLRYTEQVEGKQLEGPEIVELVAHRHSINPRLLLALLEYRSGWLTQAAVPEELFSMGKGGSGMEGLYRQLSWAANELNWGYYGRAEGNLHSFALPDNTRITFAATINHATAGVQRVLGGADVITYESWLHDVGPDGFYATYEQLFGNPFAQTIEPIMPAHLMQPALQLPWSSGETWYFTGGPHGGWNSGSAWAALDFAPEADVLGCFDSDAWVTAMSDGVVTRSGFGAVVVDLDGDKFAGTGWAVTYMHLAERDRIPAGSPVQTGDRLGHPSCEGGFSDGTHVHVARTYNGRWVAADGVVPFNLGGWVSQGTGQEYDGFLIRGAVNKEACACREESNAITAE